MIYFRCTAVQCFIGPIPDRYTFGSSPEWTMTDSSGNLADQWYGVASSIIDKIGSFIVASVAESVRT